MAKKKPITHTFQLQLSKTQEYFWRVMHRNGNEIARSSETYTRKPDTMRGLSRLIAAIKADTIAIDASQVPARIKTKQSRRVEPKNARRSRLSKESTSRSRQAGPGKDRPVKSRPASSGRVRSIPRRREHAAASRR